MNNSNIRRLMDLPIRRDDGQDIILRDRIARRRNRNPTHRLWNWLKYHLTGENRRAGDAYKDDYLPTTIPAWRRER